MAWTATGVATAPQPLEAPATVSGASWTHLASPDPLVRPMLGTRIRPNHLTTLRLATSASPPAPGPRRSAAPRATGWGGAAVAGLRLPGPRGWRAGPAGQPEAAPAATPTTTAPTTAVNALFFVAAGVALRHAWLGGLGHARSASSPARPLFGLPPSPSEWLERRSPPDTRAYTGRWGFDPDDALYLMGPLAWLGWLSPVLLGAAIGATVVMALTALRLRRMIRQA